MHRLQAPAPRHVTAGNAFAPGSDPLRLAAEAAHQRLALVAACAWRRRCCWALGVDEGQPVDAATALRCVVAAAEAAGEHGGPSAAADVWGTEGLALHHHRLLAVAAERPAAVAPAAGFAAAAVAAAEERTESAGPVEEMFGGDAHAVAEGQVLAAVAADECDAAGCQAKAGDVVDV